MRRCHLVGGGPRHEGCAERAVRRVFDRVAHPSWIARAPVTRAVPTAVAVVRFMPTCLAMLMLRRDICCWLLGALVHGPVCVLGRDLLNGSASVANRRPSSHKARDIHTRNPQACPHARSDASQAHVSGLPGELCLTHASHSALALTPNAHLSLQASRVAWVPSSSAYAASDVALVVAGRESVVSGDTRSVVALLRVACRQPDDADHLSVDTTQQWRLDGAVNDLHVRPASFPLTPL